MTAITEWHPEKLQSSVISVEFFCVILRWKKDICLCRPGKRSQYSLTSCKQPPEMSSLCGRLQEVVSYKSLDHNGSKFVLIRMW